MDEGILWEVREPYTYIISEIITRRTSLGWTQKTLANKCEVKPLIIKQVEDCIYIPRMDLILRILSTLDLTFLISSRKNKFH